MGENEVDRGELQTKIGTLQIQEEDIIQFPTGILGFADIHRYVLVEQEESFFSFLQSVDEYSVKLNEEQIELLQFDSPEDGKVYAIVTVPENVAEMTVNLQAPVVINSKKRLGAQIVITDSAYHTKHNVLAEMQKNAFFLGKQKVDGQKAEEVRESV